MAASTRQTKCAILDAIEAHGGEARLASIAQALGPEWTRGDRYAKLRLMARRMVGASVLASPRYGVYARHPTFHRRGLDLYDLTVRQIEKFLVKRGGWVATADIHKAIGARDLRGCARDAEHRRVTLALARCPKFRGDGRGFWIFAGGALTK